MGKGSGWAVGGGMTALGGTVCGGFFVADAQRDIDVWGNIAFRCFFALTLLGLIVLLVQAVLAVRPWVMERWRQWRALRRPKQKQPELPQPERWVPTAEVLDDGQVRLILSGPPSTKPSHWECVVDDHDHDWVGHVTPKELSRHQSAPISHVFPDEFDAGVPLHIPPGSYRVRWTQSGHGSPENPITLRLGEMQFNVPHSLRHDHSGLWVPTTSFVLEDAFGRGVRLEIEGPLEDGLCNFRCRVDLPDDTSAFAEDVQREPLIDASQPSTGSDFHYPGEFRFTNEDSDKFQAGDYVAIWMAIEPDPEGIGTEALPLTLAVLRFHFDGQGRFGLGTQAEPSCSPTRAEDDMTRSLSRNWDHSRFPAADRELSDAEIAARYGDTIEDFIRDVQGEDMRTLTFLATAGQRLAANRAARERLMHETPDAGWSRAAAD